MPKFLSATVIAAVLMLAAACSIATGTAPPWLNRPLAPPLELHPALQISHQLTAEFGGTEHQLLGVVVSTPERLQVVGLTLQGSKLFNASWDGQHLDSWRQEQVPHWLEPANIIADVQLTYYPQYVLQAALPADWQLRDYPRRRELYHKGILWVSVDYGPGSNWRQHVIIEHRQLAYRLIIQPEIADHRE